MAVPLFNLAPDLSVSRLCLGIPETQGRSEEYLGRWIRSRNISRDRVVIATKVCGPSGKMTWIRNGPESVDSRNIADALDNSLLRLQSDYIDLYQIHWPDRFVNSLFLVKPLHSIDQYTCQIKNDFRVWDSGVINCITSMNTTKRESCRYVPMFGETEFDPNRTLSSVSFEEQLTALEKAICSGKIRYVGLSNETPYGLMKFLHVAEGVSSNTKIVSVQNAYNLLSRNFDSGMAECIYHERVSLLAYSPLAMGILSGKYLALDGGPSDARLNLFKGRYAEGESRYNLSDSVVAKATKLYCSIAKKYNVHPVSLAIAFVLKHPLVASAVFGATKLCQLQEVLDGCRIELTPQIVAEINEVHSTFPNPCP